MAENLIIGTGNKEEKYRELLPQLHALVSTETDLGSSSNLVVISFLFHRSSSFLILLKVVDMFAF